jgi:hypothetical protein
LRSLRRQNAAEVPTAREAGLIRAAAQGIEVEGRGRVPAGLLVKFKAATGKQLRG